MSYTAQRFTQQGAREVLVAGTTNWVSAATLTQAQLGLAIGLPTTGQYFLGGAVAST